MPARASLGRSAAAARAARTEMSWLPEPDVAATTIYLHPQYSALAAARPDFQDEAVAIRVATRCRKVSDLVSGQDSHGATIASQVLKLKPVEPLRPTLSPTLGIK